VANSHLPLAYHENLHTKFMEHQNWNDDPVADELQQLASYFEFPKAGEHFINAGDGINSDHADWAGARLISRTKENR
jgi:hypothetical protein